MAHLGWRAGKPVRRYFVRATPEEAIAARGKFLDGRRDGFTPQPGRPLYVDEWMLHWLNVIAKRKVKASTWERSYRQKVTELICPYFERIPLPELDEEHIEAWHAELEDTISERTGRPLSASTIAQAHRIMSRALKVAVTRKRMARNPCSNVTPPAGDYEARPPSRDEVTKILARCETWPNGARWVVALTTGLRQGEALALEWRDVDLRPDGGTITVREGKTRNARRTIDLLLVAAVMLKRHRKAQKVADLNGLVFTRPDGRPVHPRADWQDWQDLLADLHLPRYRVHDCRHATATLMLEAGEDIRIVQAMMGHATPDFTRRAYQHVTPVMKRRAAQRLDEYLRGGG